jgi:hypothetical protein
LILLTTFTYPTIEAVFTIACGLGADELNEFIAFEGRGVASMMPVFVAASAQ